MAIDESSNGWSAVVKLGEATAAAISGLTTTVFGLTATITELKQDVGDLKQDVGDLKKDVGDLKKDVGVLRSDILTVRTDVMSRMDRLQDKLSSVTDDLTVNLATALKSDRLARNSMEETRALSDQVNALQIMVRRISAKVFGPDDLH